MLCAKMSPFAKMCFVCENNDDELFFRDVDRYFGVEVARE